MKLYQLCLLSTAFFHLFLCLGMDQMNEYSHFFQTGGKKLSLPEPYRKELVDYCESRLQEREIQKLGIENAQLLQKIKDSREDSQIINAQVTKTLEEITTLKQQAKALEKKSIVPTIKSCSTKQQPLPDKKTTNSPVQNIGKKLSSQDKLKAMRLLMAQYNVREKSVLLLELKAEADKAFSNNSPDFDKKNHFFCQKINARYRCIFCPCTNRLEIVDNSLAVPLPKDFTCSDNCSFYKAKNAYSSNSEIDTSTETESESDTQEKIPEVTPYTKKQIENLADYM